MTERIQAYEEALSFLFDRINFEQTPANGEDDFKLGRMRQLLVFVGDPQDRFPIVHIAGTKGKGSTAIMLAEILSSAGFRVGLYTSPHVEAFEERMQVAGQRPTPDQIIELVRQVKVAVNRCESTASPFSPTFFEVTTALAWLFFERQKADIVILEVGLGGRLDSTNVCSPIACVLTTISRDHCQLLGSNLNQIAREKAGIVKPKVPVVSGVQSLEAQEVIFETCRSQQSQIWQLGQHFHYEHSPHDGLRMNAFGTISSPASFGTVDVTTPMDRWQSVPLTLAGEHQAHNAAVALATIDTLRKLGWSISQDAVQKGMANVRWPMRIEVMAQNPTVIVDAGHNWESIAALCRTLEESFSASLANDSQSRRVLVLAASKDKDILGISRLLLPHFDSIILTRYLKNPRAVLPSKLLQVIRSVSDIPCHVTSTPDEAWQLARRLTKAEDLVCVTGSFFIAAEMRELILRDIQAARIPE